MLSNQAFENRESGSILLDPVDQQRQQGSQRSGNGRLVMVDQTQRPIAQGIAWCALTRRQNNQPALLKLQKQRACGHVLDAARVVAPIPQIAQLLRQTRSIPVGMFGQQTPDQCHFRGTDRPALNDVFCIHQDQV